MAKGKPQIKKRLGETLYPGEKIVTKTVGLTPTQVHFLERDAASLSIKTGERWTRSKVIQFLTDQYMKKREREEEAK